MKAKYSFSDFRHTNCQLWHADSTMFFAVWTHTQGNPCPGCAHFKNGQCPDHQQVIGMNSHRPVGDKVNTEETNAQLAKRLGISKRQASKIRQRKRKEGAMLS